ncbi:MAG TPA: hypothetical protein VM577_14655 [Anaerovoracaceae bacterium]|nr:hypothetical protein [Anaerovoracaceae bacterium]
MKYRFYLRLKLQDDNWVEVGNRHEIEWDNRDLIKASSGWLIVNQEKIGTASDLIPKLHKGIIELKNSSETYMEYELNHGLGTIKNVLAFYEELLQDCNQFPYTELCGCIAG